MQCVPTAGGATVRVLSPFTSANATPVGWTTPRGTPQAPQAPQSPGRLSPVQVRRAHMGGGSLRLPASVTAAAVSHSPGPTRAHKPPAFVPQSPPRADIAAHSNARGASRVDELSSSTKSLQDHPQAAQVLPGQSLPGQGLPAQVLPAQFLASQPAQVLPAQGHPVQGQPAAGYPAFPKVTLDPRHAKVAPAANEEDPTRRISQLQLTRQELERELALHNAGGQRSDDDRHRLRGLVDQVQGMLREIINVGCVDALDGRHHGLDDASHPSDTGKTQVSALPTKPASISAPVLPPTSKAAPFNPASPLSTMRIPGGPHGAGMPHAYSAVAPASPRMVDPSAANLPSSTILKPTSAAMGMDPSQGEGNLVAKRLVQRSPQRLKPWAWQEGPPRYRAGSDGLAGSMDSTRSSNNPSSEQAILNSDTPFEPATSSSDLGYSTPTRGSFTSHSQGQTLPAAEEMVYAYGTSSTLEAAVRQSSGSETSETRPQSGVDSSAFRQRAESEPSLADLDLIGFLQQKVVTPREFTGGMDSNYSEAEEATALDPGSLHGKGVRPSSSLRTLKKGTDFKASTSFPNLGQAAPRVPALSSGSPRSRATTPIYTNSKQTTARNTPRPRRSAQSPTGAESGISYPFGSSQERFGNSRSGSNTSHARGNVIQQRRIAPGASVQLATPRKSSSKSPSPSRGSTPLQQQGARLQSKQRMPSPRCQEALGTHDSRRSLGARSESRKSISQSDLPIEQERTGSKGVSTCQQSPREQSRPNEATLQSRLSAAMKAENQNLLPGAADKWKVLQLFYESIPRASVRVERIDRVVSLANYFEFTKDSGLDECEVRYYVPAGPSQLARLQDSGFCRDDFEEVRGSDFGIPVYGQASDAYKRACAQYNLLEDRQGAERCLCVLLSSPGAGRRHEEDCSANGSVGASLNFLSEEGIMEPENLLLAYVIWCIQLSASGE